MVLGNLWFTGVYTTILILYNGTLWRFCSCQRVMMTETRPSFFWKEKKPMENSLEWHSLFLKPPLILIPIPFLIFLPKNAHHLPCFTKTLLPTWVGHWRCCASWKVRAPQSWGLELGGIFQAWLDFFQSNLGVKKQFIHLIWLEVFLGRHGFLSHETLNEWEWIDGRWWNGVFFFWKLKMAPDMHFNRRDVSLSWSPDSYPVSHADASGQQNYGVNTGGQSLQSLPDNWTTFWCYKLQDSTATFTEGTKLAFGGSSSFTNTFWKRERPCCHPFVFFLHQGDVRTSVETARWAGNFGTELFGVNKSF